VSLDPRGRVSTIVGVALFEFGDIDGQGEMVRLQHPLGVSHHNGMLYVADTYNHKIKVIGPYLRSSVTFLGTGKPGFRDGDKAEFYEPSGLSIADGKLYIADTNNHAIRVADLQTKQVSTLQITGLSNGMDTGMADVWPNLQEITLPTQTLRQGQGCLSIDVAIPVPYKLNPGSPLEYRVDVKGNAPQSGKTVTIQEGKFPLQIPFVLPSETTEIVATMSFVYCRDGDAGVCIIKSLRWTVPVQMANEGNEAIQIIHQLQPEL